MASNVGTQVSKYVNSRISRHDFPSDFVFGAATSAYQIEGAFKEDGKAMSNWDIFSICHPDKIEDGTNGCLAIDHYNRFKDDVTLMKKMGLDAYRFSISWARILPGGRLSAGVNRNGVQFYNDLINELLSQGIVPYVTLFHFDVPQCLEEEYGGFVSPKIIPDFLEYAHVCFFEFGDRVKYWITHNEPWTFAHNGYIMGNFPPARGLDLSAPTAARTAVAAAPRYRSAPRVNQATEGGDAATEPYIVAHHLILSHAAAVDAYRKNYQAVQGGKIGITNMTTWYFPLYETEEDIAAASRAVDFMWGWFTAPIVNGDYPPVMRERVGSRLPTFTADEKKLITGSFDFIGLNYYTSNYAAHIDYPSGTPPNYYVDVGAQFSTERDGIPIGEQAGSPWLFIVPEGFYELLTHTKNEYNDPLIYVTENGMSDRSDHSLTIPKARIDNTRVRYHQEHLAMLKKSMDEDGVNVKAYFLWSMFDNYEWAEGYLARFGMFYVDYVNGLHRYPKSSALWYMNFLNKNKILSAKRQAGEEVEDVNSSAKKKRLR